MTNIDAVHDGSDESAGTAARGSVQAVDRVAAILRCFGGRPSVGITELSRDTGLTTSTVHRLLSAMADNRLIVRRSDRRYELGPLVAELAGGQVVEDSLLAAGRDVIRAIRDQVDETVGLHELAPSGSRVVVDQAESRQELRRTYVELGTPMPLTQGAPSKAILAFLPHDVQEWWLALDVPPLTPGSITDPDRLRADLAGVRTLGYAVSIGERATGIRTVAAPVFGRLGTVVGAIGITGPDIRIPDRRLREFAHLTRTAAWDISRALGATRDAVERHRPAATPGGTG